jgi:hypothetical protein
MPPAIAVVMLWSWWWWWWWWGMEDESLWKKNGQRWPAYKGLEHWMPTRRTKRRHRWMVGGTDIVGT